MLLKGEIRILFSWEIPAGLSEDGQEEFRDEVKEEFRLAQSNVKALLEVWDVVYSAFETEADFD